MTRNSAPPGSSCRSLPRLLPVPSAWWETPAVTSRALSARPEEPGPPGSSSGSCSPAGAWALTDDAEMIIDELVVNAVLHGTRAGQNPKPAPPWRWPGGAAALRAQEGRRGHARGGRPRERDADAQAAGLGRGKRPWLADRRSAQPRVDGAPSPARKRMAVLREP